MKSKVVIVVVVLLIIIFALILILNKNNTKTVTNSSGETQINVELNQKMLDKINTDVEEGYTKIEKNNITTSSDISVEAITYKDASDEKGEKTLVRVYLTVNGVEAVDKNSVLTISLYDKDHRLLHKFGGVMEAITLHSMTMVKTQFLSKAGDAIYANVSFESDVERDYYKEELEIKNTQSEDFWRANRDGNDL